MSRAGTFLPLWALQFVIGMFAVLLAVGLFVALIGTVVRGPSTFFDEFGKTVARIAPQPQADMRSDAELRSVIKALPDGRLRVRERRRGAGPCRVHRDGGPGGGKGGDAGR